MAQESTLNSTLKQLNLFNKIFDNFDNIDWLNDEYLKIFLKKKRISCSKSSITLPNCSNNRNIIIAIFFTNELDLIELNILNSLDMADKIYIIESMFDNKGLKRSLVFPRISHIFSDKSKIEYLINYELIKDDNNVFRTEQVVADNFWNKILKLHNSNNSILISAHADEIIDQLTLFKLKHCEIPDSDNFVPEGIFYYGAFNKPYGDSYKDISNSSKFISYPYPSIWKGDRIKELYRFSHKQLNCRNCSVFGLSYHFSPWPNIYYELTKLKTCSECKHSTESKKLMIADYQKNIILDNYVTLSLISGYINIDMSQIDQPLSYPKCLLENKFNFPEFFIEKEKWLEILLNQM